MYLCNVKCINQQCNYFFATAVLRDFVLANNKTLEKTIHRNQTPKDSSN